MGDTTAVDGMDTGTKVVIGGAVLAVIGAFLPWLTVDAGALGQTSVTGMDGDGVITLVAALVAGGVVAFRDWDTITLAVVLLGGLAVGGIGLYYVTDPAAGVDNPIASELVEADIGLYATVVAGIAIVGGAVMGYSD